MIDDEEVEEVPLNQTCIKVRLFEDDETLTDELIEDVMNEIAEVLVAKGFNNQEFLNSIVTVDATDLIPMDIDEAGLVDYIVNYEKAAGIFVPGITK